MHTIEAKNLNKTFSSKIAVHNLSFKIAQGSVTALLGPNGAGKTTTMRLLTGFLSATSGDIFYDGVSLEKNSHDIKRRLGYLPELAPLYYDMTILEYLKFMAKIREIPRDSINKNIEKMIETCELKSHLYNPIYSLSKGFKQRVALAGTLIHNPDFIILDEPTSGLDPNQIAHIRKVIQDLGQKNTLILSTHILQEVEEICEYVIIINKGKLVTNSRVKELNKGNQIEVVINIKEDELQPFLKNESLSLSNKEFLGEESWFSYTINLEHKKPEEIFEYFRKTTFPIREFKITQKSIENIFEEVTR